MYKGKTVANCVYGKKLENMKTMFESDLKESMYSDIKIRLVVMTHTLDELVEVLLCIPYDIYSVKYVNMEENGKRVILSKNIFELKKRQEKILVRYLGETELYAMKENENNIIVVNDLKTSMYMSNIFANDPNITARIECVYSKKHKGWVPTCL